MATKERRISPRKECAVPLRFRVANSGNQSAGNVGGEPAVRLSSYAGTIEGESVNLSERGIYFRSRHRVNVGEPIEMYFTIPQELTGRGAEQVRCSARVVHVKPEGAPGILGIGAAVERFEPMPSARDWGN